MQELLPRLPCKHGRPKTALELWWAYPYSAPAHSWPPPSSRAVCSAIIPWIAGLSSSVFSTCISACSTDAPNPRPPCCIPHCRLVPPKCSLSNSVLKSQNPENLPYSWISRPGPSSPWRRRRLTTFAPWAPCEAATADPLLAQCSKIPRASDLSRTASPQLARAERCRAGHSPPTPTQIRVVPSPDTRLWARRTSP